MVVGMDTKKMPSVTRQGELLAVDGVLMYKDGSRREDLRCGGHWERLQ